MFKEDEEEDAGSTCTLLADECRHDPLFNVSDESSGECFGAEMTLSDILELIDNNDDGAIKGVKELIQASLDDEITFNGIICERVG